MEDGDDRVAANGHQGGDAGERGGWASSTLGLLGKKEPYCLRAHVFQCRGLPSSEASGLLDPYIKVTAYYVLCAFVSFLLGLAE